MSFKKFPNLQDHTGMRSSSRVVTTHVVSLQYVVRSVGAITYIHTHKQNDARRLFWDIVSVDGVINTCQ